MEGLKDPHAVYVNRLGDARTGIAQNGSLTPIVTTDAYVREAEDSVTL